MTPERKPATVAGIVAAVAGAAVGLYAGAALLIPLALAFVIFWLGTKILSGRRLTVLPPFAVTGGQLAWLVLAMLITGAFGANLVDVALFSLLLAWLIAGPSRAALGGLAICQGAALSINAYLLTSTPWGTAEHKSLVVHVTFRIAAIVLCVAALRAFGTAAPAAVDDASRRTPAAPPA